MSTERTRKDYIVTIEAFAEQASDIEIFAKLLLKHPYVVAIEPISPPQTGDAEEVLSKHTGETGIYLTKGMVRGSDALEAMEEYANIKTAVYRNMVYRLAEEMRRSEWDSPVYE